MRISSPTSAMLAPPPPAPGLRRLARLLPARLRPGGPREWSLLRSRRCFLRRLSFTSHTWAEQRSRDPRSANPSSPAPRAGGRGGPGMTLSGQDPSSASRSSCCCSPWGTEARAAGGRGCAPAPGPHPAADVLAMLDDDWIFNNINETARWFQVEATCLCPLYFYSKHRQTSLLMSVHLLNITNSTLHAGNTRQLPILSASIQLGKTFKVG